MRYINLRFTYLLTHLLICSSVSLQTKIVACYSRLWLHQTVYIWRVEW